MAKVKITETVLRDSHQSLIATRMTTEEMLPILETMDEVGYHSLEAWGGATFDACMRFLNEDPWERLRKIRERVKNTKLSSTLTKMIGATLRTLKFIYIDWQSVNLSNSSL